MDTLRAFAGGILLGLMTANKLTMFVIGVMPLIPVVLRSPFRPKLASLKIFLAGVGAFSGFYFVLLWLYLFSPTAVYRVMLRWAAVVTQPVGGDSGFWPVAFKNYIIGNLYGFIILFYLLAFLVSICSYKRVERTERSAFLINLLATVVGGAALAYIVWKRPAGTTLHEAAIALLICGCMALARISHLRVSTGFLATVMILAGAATVATFPMRGEVSALTGSRTWGARMWKLHLDLLAFSNRHDVIDIFPNNSYNYSGVEECLLKGTADFLSWNLNPKAQPLLARYAPNLTFRHEYSGVSPDAPFPPRAIVFWVDVPYQPPVSGRYPRLKQLDQEVGTRRADWMLTGGLVAHAIEVPSTN